MIKKIKRGLISVSISMLCGFICGKFIYKIYESENSDIFNNNKVYLINSGSYNSYENMRTKTIGYDYVFYEDNGQYNSIIGVTKNKDNIDKILKLYNIDAEVREFYINDNNVNNKIIEYDNLLLKENDNNKIKEIVELMLKEYKNSKIILSKNY